MVGRVKKIISAFIIAFSVILFWRGCWHLADLYLFPETQWLSSIASILIALIVLVASHKFVKEVV